MQTHRSSVGIVTRTKNRKILLQRALKSITEQTYDHWRLIVVNDGGDREKVDAVVEKFSDFKHKIDVVHHATSKGMEAASNTALRMLDTEFAVIHDDDDTWDPRFLERAVEVFYEKRKEFPSIRGVCCHSDKVVETIEGDTVTIHAREPYNHWMAPGPVFFERMLFRNMIPNLSFLFRLDACKEVGMFDEHLPVAGDWEFNIRFLLRYDIWVFGEVLAYYHHRDNVENDLANSFAPFQDKHAYIRTYLLNKWLREDLTGKGNGLGFYTNYRENMERLLMYEPLLRDIDNRTKYIERMPRRILEKIKKFVIFWK